MKPARLFPRGNNILERQSNKATVTKRELYARTFLGCVLVSVTIGVLVAIASGIHSALVLDALHIFWWLGLPEPFNHSGMYGRPDHTAIDFTFLSIVSALLFAGVLASFVRRFNARRMVVK